MLPCSGPQGSKGGPYSDTCHHPKHENTPSSGFSFPLETSLTCAVVRQAFNEIRVPAITSTCPKQTLPLVTLPKKATLFTLSK